MDKSLSQCVWRARVEKNEWMNELMYKRSVDREHRLSFALCWQYLNLTNHIYTLRFLQPIISRACKSQRFSHSSTRRTSPAKKHRICLNTGSMMATACVSNIVCAMQLNCEVKSESLPATITGSWQLATRRCSIPKCTQPNNSTTAHLTCCQRFNMMNAHSVHP